MLLSSSTSYTPFFTASRVLRSRKSSKLNKIEIWPKTHLVYLITHRTWVEWDKFQTKVIPKIFNTKVDLMTTPLTRNNKTLTMEILSWKKLSMSKAQIEHTISTQTIWTSELIKIKKKLMRLMISQIYLLIQIISLWQLLRAIRDLHYGGAWRLHFVQWELPIQQLLCSHIFH